MASFGCFINHLERNTNSSTVAKTIVASGIPPARTFREQVIIGTYIDKGITFSVIFQL
jgi:hypothetical protein